MKTDFFDDSIEQNLSVVVEDLKIIKDRLEKLNVVDEEYKIQLNFYDEMQRLENCISLLNKWR